MTLERVEGPENVPAAPVDRVQHSTGCGKPHLTWLGLLWSAPASLVGIAFALCSDAIPRPRNGLLIAQSTRGLADLFLTQRGYAAITFGRVVILTVNPWPDLLMHESHHTRQYGLLGPFFLPVYLWFNVTRGYADNPLERSAVACAAEST